MPARKSKKAPRRSKKTKGATPPRGKGRKPAREPRAVQGTPANAGEKQDDARDAAGRFKKGRSGNPAGKPPGTRHRATLLAQALLDGEAEAVTRAVIAAAKGGDIAAAKLVIERLVPPRRSVPVDLELPSIATAEDLVAASGEILRAVAEGRLLPDEAERLAKVLADFARTLETAQLARRLDELEELLAKALKHDQRGRST
jgi:hypothetical protein